MSTTQVVEDKQAKPIVVSEQLLNTGADVVLRLRPNGLEQHDKEIVMINLSRHVNNDQNPEWQKLMQQVGEVAQENNAPTSAVLGPIVDRAFERLG
jgi:hypothetical protein